MGQVLAGASPSAEAMRRLASRCCKPALEKLHAARYELLTTAFNIALAKGWRHRPGGEGLALIDATIRRVEAHGDLVYMPELLRVKGGLLLAMQQATPPRPRRASGSRWRVHVTKPRRPGSCGPLPTWRRCWPGRAGPARPQSLLRPVFERFTEGAETADLQAAARRLATLG